MRFIKLKKLYLKENLKQMDFLFLIILSIKKEKIINPWIIALNNQKSKDLKIIYTVIIMNKNNNIRISIKIEFKKL